MREDSERAWIIRLTVSLVVTIVVVGWYLSACDDCTRRGGVLVDDSFGIPRCVEGAPK